MSALKIKLNDFSNGRLVIKQSTHDDSNFPANQEESWLLCEQILQKVMNHQLASPFNQPVDCVAFPDYKNLVKTPMDLGTVKDDLSRRAFRSTQHFDGAVRRVWHNAMKYNAPRDHVHIMAKRMRRFYEDQMREAGLKPFKNTHRKDSKGRLPSKMDTPLLGHRSRKRKHEHTHEDDPFKSGRGQAKIAKDKAFAAPKPRSVYRDGSPQIGSPSDSSDDSEFYAFSHHRNLPLPATGTNQLSKHSSSRNQKANSFRAGRDSNVRRPGRAPLTDFRGDPSGHHNLSSNHVSRDPTSSGTSASFPSNSYQSRKSAHQTTKFSSNFSSFHIPKRHSPTTNGTRSDMDLLNQQPMGQTSSPCGSRKDVAALKARLISLEPQYLQSVAIWLKDVRVQKDMHEVLEQLYDLVNCVDFPFDRLKDKVDHVHKKQMIMRMPLFSPPIVRGHVERGFGMWGSFSA